MTDRTQAKSALNTVEDKLLFTPGPLTTSMSVKRAMLHDLGSRDVEFVAAVRRVREKLLEVAGLSKQQGFEAVLMQGSGTFGIESVISSTVPRGTKLLTVINGAYGDRIRNIAERHGIDTVAVTCAENEWPATGKIDQTLDRDRSISQVAVVHCETTSGIMNPIEEIGHIVRRHGRLYTVDSMSAFGAVPFDFEDAEIDFLISSSNKCLEGVPGFSFAICRRDALQASEGCARTLSLDLLAQWQGLETNGQFRFTPPTHAILAFRQALAELEEEGGVAGRANRYRANHECLVAGMRELGFREYVPREWQGYIITSFCYPDHPQWDFERFYNLLSKKGFLIYPGKVSHAACFRIGNIGRLFEADMRALLEAVRTSLAEMDFN